MEEILLKEPKPSRFLPGPKLGKVKKFLKSRFFSLLLIIFLSSFFGFLAGTLSGSYFYSQMRDYFSKIGFELPPLVSQKSESQPEVSSGVSQLTQEKLVIEAVKQASPAVVSIIITKDLPVFEEYYINPSPAPESPFEEFFLIPEQKQKGTEKKEIGGGTGFIISQDGIVLTNKHVVVDKEAQYTVLTNEGKKYSTKILAIDPVQDLAILKIEGENFPYVFLGNSSNLEIGQTVITIGNALGEFRNTVSVGVISGLGRTIIASGGGMAEVLEDIIQTDAAINLGNSGGPLLNLKGEVIGVNVAMAEGAQSIGFALPIDKAKRGINQVKTIGKIVYPFLGVRYVLITEKLQEEKELPVDYGALIVKGRQGESAVTLDSAADKAGLKEGDIILELNGEKITSVNSLSKIIQKYNPQDKVTLKILRSNEEKIIEAILGERSE